MKKNKIGTRYLAGTFFFVYLIIALFLNLDTSYKEYIAICMFGVLFISELFIFKK